VLEQLRDTRKAMFLHALADLLEPMHVSCNVERTAQCNLSMLTAELNSLSDKLEMLHASCVVLQGMGGTQMASLRKATKNSVAKVGLMFLCDQPCFIKLGVHYVSSADLTDRGSVS
jgi:hypothetical protein